MASAAIDFGTLQTRLAAFDRRRRRPVIRGELPTVAYVPKTGPILVGQEAQQAIINDPAGAVDDLKHRLNGNEFLRNRRLCRPIELIGLLFAEARRQALGQLETADPLTECVLTIPSQLDIQQGELLIGAARIAGFSEAHLIDEAIAGARYWERNQRISGNVVVVCDLGQTARIAVLRRPAEAWRTDLEICPPTTFECGDSALPRLLFDGLRGVAAELAKRGLPQAPLLIVGGGGNDTGIEVTMKLEDWPGEVFVALEPELAAASGAVEAATGVKVDVGSSRAKPTDSIRCPECDVYPVSMIAIACPQCGYPLRVSPRQPTPIARPTSMNCPECGVPVASNLTACRSCGCPLRDTERVSTVRSEWVSHDGTLSLGDFHIPDLNSIIAACSPMFRSGDITRLHLMGEDWLDEHVKRLRDLLLPDARGDHWVVRPPDAHLNYVQGQHPAMTTLEITSAGRLSASAMLHLASLSTLTKVNLSMWRARETAVDGIQQLARLPNLQTIHLPASLDRLPSFGGATRREALCRSFQKSKPAITVL